MPISIKKDLQKEIRGICTYHGDEGTNGYSLSEEQFEKLFELYDQAISLTLQRVKIEAEGMKPDERKVSFFGEWQAKTYNEKMLVRSVLDDLIKKLE